MKLKKIRLLAIAVLLGICSHFIYAAPASSEDAAEDDTVTVPAKSKDAIGKMLLQSVSLIGIPYRWGGNTPETGMDCSGFIRYLYKTSLGINLPRTSAEMSKVGKRVPVDKIEPGDLLFFNTRRGANTHVGMYLGNNKMVVAPRTGQDIQIAEINSYYRTHLNGAKRIVQENEDDDGNTTLENFEDNRDEALPGGSYRKHSARHGGKSRSHRRSTGKKSKTSAKSAYKAKVKKKNR